MTYRIVGWLSFGSVKPANEKFVGKAGDDILVVEYTN